VSPTGVILGQVGTPDAPTSTAVRRYLARFLSDRRVVDYSPLVWQPLLRGVILPLRGRRSAALYRRIWTADGSPLIVESRKQLRALQARLGEAYRVELGMAYAGPSFESAVERLIDARVTRLVVLPMFPQYSSSTSASIYDAVNRAATGRAGLIRNGLRRFVPAVCYVPPFFDDPRYIGALAARMRRTIAEMPAPPDRIIITFHGLPERYVTTGDPYRAHCERTVRLLVDQMRWKDADYTVCFQSRFGREKWLEPETAGVLSELAGRGVRRPLILAPGFTADCLETLDELGNDGRHQFQKGGGDPGAYVLSPCLNDLPEWIDCMAQLVQRAAAKGDGHA
jgi:ferrochelatase